MATPKTTLWPLEEHTKAKHEILKRYLQAWFPILSTYSNKIVYIDGFCGPGRYEKGEPGSPIIALEVATTHRKDLTGKVEFLFTDENEDRINHLKSELEKLSIPHHFNVSVNYGKFHEQFDPVLASIENSQTPPPSFVFIDPFGFSGIPFSQIKRLLKQPKCEAMITFMVDSINRWLEHPNDSIKGHIEETFGTTEVVDIAFTEENRTAGLRKIYQIQLKSIARYVRYFEMRDKNDRIQYYLFFVTNNRLGHIKMKEAMWKINPAGDFRFSDATDPNQLILFEHDNTDLVVKILRNNFSGKNKVVAKNVRTFLEDETAYLKKHMTEALRKEEHDRNIIVDGIKADGKKRRANSYPDNALISFMKI